MSLVDKQTLSNLGIKLNDRQYQAMAEQFDATIHRRVIDQIASLLTDQQVEQLADISDTQATSFEDWLDVNLPEFPEIVSDEVDILLGEIAQNADKLSTQLQTKLA